MANIRVKFNRKELEEMAFLNAKNLNNMNDEDARKKAREIVKKKADSLREMAAFMGASCIRYQDHGKAETYTINKDRKELILSVCGNQFDGGYMNPKVL